MEIRFSCEPVSSLDAVEALWRRLENGETPFFVSSTWIGTWLRCLPEHVRPLLLTATEDGEAIGAAILVPRQERRRGMHLGQLHFNSTGDRSLDCLWIEHNGFAGKAEVQRELWPALLRWFTEQAEADELLVPRAAYGAVGGPPPETKLLHAAIASQGFRSVLPAGGVDAILAQLSANTRQQLRRSLRACEQQGELRCEAAETVESALAWFAALKALHVSSWERRGKPHGFRYPFAETFHRALIGRGVPQGSVQLLRISAGSTVLGYLYNFHRGETVFAYQSGFDDRRSAELKPGYVSHLLAMAAGAAAAATRYDFLEGDNQLKRSLGRERYTLYSHRFAKPKLGLRIEAGFRSARRRFGF